MEMLTEEQKAINEKVEKLMLDENNEYGGPVSNSHRKAVTEAMIKEQIKFLGNINESAPANTTTGGVANWDPILIRMVRRGAPKLMAFDLAGVQPMSGPTGSIFSMRARYSSQTGSEALFNEANSAFSGVGSQTGDTSGFAADAFSTGDPAVGTGKGTGMPLSDAETRGTTEVGALPWAEMTFTIDRVDVSAKSRKLKASFSRELQHDLMQIHGLSAETELSNILITEINAEQDRELLRTINIAAKLGAQDTQTPGSFDLDNDTDGRWLVEKFKGLLFAIELEANHVGIATRRGKANRVICSANVASALNMAGLLDYAPEIVSRLNVDPASQSFAGVLLGSYQVHVDPYATVDYVTVGYKGASAWDAGIYWCPYVPLEMVRAVGEESFQPRIGFATRYGIIANPFTQKQANGSDKTGKGLGQGENEYFRKFRVTSIRGV